MTLDGQAVSRAVITFTPEKGPPSYGGSNAEGQYSVLFTADKKGAVIGKHMVTIPLGARARLDADAKTIDILEAGVA